MSLFVINVCEEEKIMHKCATINFVKYFTGLEYNKKYCEIKFIQNQKPYQIVIILINNKEKTINYFLFNVIDVVSPQNDDPWFETDKWVNLIKMSAEKNLLIASTIRDTASLYSIKDINSFESIVNQVFNSYGGEYLYKSVLSKTAFLMYHIVKDHPFADGNKRTALLTALSMLNACGYTLVISDLLEVVEATAEFMVYIADSSPEDRDQVIEKIKDYIKLNVTIDIRYQLFMSEKFVQNMILLSEKTK